MKLFLFLSVVMMALFGTRPIVMAKHHHTGAANQHMHRHDFDELVARFEAPERATWQKPELVVATLGDVSGKTVADVGAGTGYFSFPIAKKAGRVLAIDIDQRMLDFIENGQRKKATGENIETRVTTPDDPGLADGEADIVIIVNTYHHIEDRIAYLGKLRKGLNENGRLFITDFFKRELPVGPPPHIKLSKDDDVAELEFAGFRNISTDTTTLPYQYIVTAR